jgi:hypothetical protein
MTAPDARRPDPSEAPPYFAGYLATVPDGSLLDTLQGTGDALAAWIARRTAAQLAGRPAPGKWTVGEALQHVLDTERVFTFRLLWIARGAPDPLPGFDQDAWVPTSGAERRSAAESSTHTMLRVRRQSPSSRSESPRSTRSACSRPCFISPTVCGRWGSRGGCGRVRQPCAERAG